MPYASSTGAPNSSSIFAIISGGSAALHDRIKRSPSRPAGGSFARDNSKLWMVGTAEYQVAPVSLTVRQNDSGLNLFGTATVPPESKVESVDATSPCTWNSGITHSETSLSVRL